MCVVAQTCFFGNVFVPRGVLIQYIFSLLCLLFEGLLYLTGGYTDRNSQFQRCVIVVFT